MLLAEPDVWMFLIVIFDKPQRFLSGATYALY